MDSFIRECEKLNIEITDKMQEQLLKYYEMLIEKNKVMNLTAITEKSEVYEKHFLDSLYVVKVLDLSKEGLTLIDVGTGAGFPGLVLKIVFPGLKVTLLDSLNKRLNFLKEVIDELGLKDVELVHARAEDGGRDPKLRERFDISTARAVANLSTLSEYCLPFVKPGGCFIAYKSQKSEEETLAAKGALFKLSGKIASVEKYTLADTDMYRTLIKVDKVSKMAKTYPRKAGTPSKEPL